MKTHKEYDEDGKIISETTTSAARDIALNLLGWACINGCFLDELDPSAGRYEAEPDISCEGACIGARRELEHCET